MAKGQRGLTLKAVCEASVKNAGTDKEGSEYPNGMQQDK